MLSRMIFAALLVGISQQAALAQYPAKPVHIVVRERCGHWPTSSGYVIDAPVRRGQRC